MQCEQNKCRVGGGFERCTGEAAFTANEGPIFICAECAKVFQPEHNKFAGNSQTYNGNYAKPGRFGSRKRYHRTCRLRRLANTADSLKASCSTLTLVHGE